MLTASQLLDQLGAKVMEGLPAPPGVWIRVMECPGREPNWIAEVSMPLPLAIAERWAGVLAEFQWNSPDIDFSHATGNDGGERSVTKDLSAINRAERDVADRDRALASTVPRDPNRRDLKSVLRLIAGIPIALAIAVAAVIAMAE